MQETGALLLPLLLIALLGFMVWNQRRRQKAMGALQSSLKIGDDICTTSGLFGRIVALDDVVATLEVAPGQTVRYDRRAVALKVDASGRPVGQDPAAPGATSTPATPPSDTPVDPSVDKNSGQ